MALEGTKQIRVTVLIDIHPSVAPEQAVAMLSTGGISFAAGLLPYIRNIDTQIEDKMKLQA